MSQFYDQASLVMVPSGYKAGKVYSQKPLSTDGELSFSRASNATRVNSSGLVEKVRTNLLLQSNSFDTTWFAGGTISVTSGQSGYDSSNDAWLLNKTQANAHWRQDFTFNGSVVTYSFYVKAGSLNWVNLNYGGTNSFFDLANGLTGITTAIDSSIEAVGATGWYRCSVINNYSGTSSLRIYPADADNDTSGTSGNILIQAAQLETGDIATDYIATTTTAVSVGPVSGLPRLDYSGGASCCSLLLEGQRTNLLTFSEQMDNAAWTPQNGAIVTANTAVSPDGYTNADTLEKVGGSGGIGYYYLVTSAVSNTTNTGSFFAKYKEGSGIIWLLGKDSGSFAFFNLQTGTALSASGSMTTKIEAYSNGWYRCSFTQDYTGASAYTFGIGLCLVDGTPNYDATSASTQGVYIWGAQLEAGAYATSYIPTLSSAVTRVADAASKTGISSLIGQTEGTIFLEFDHDITATAPLDTRIHLSSGTTANWIFFGFPDGGGKLLRFYINDSSGALSFYSSSPVVQGKNKVAFGYKSGDFVAYLNGTQVATNSTVRSIPVCSQIDLQGGAPSSVAQERANIEQVLLFTSRLSNADLATLTAL